MSPGPPPKPSLGDAQTRASMTEEEARLIQETIVEHCGLSYGLDSTFFLERRVAPRLEALGLQTYRQYYHYLRYDPGGPTELETVVERLTTHETYLFREQYQLDAFGAEVLPELHQRLGRYKRLMMWSAGCSTGEEAYTLAILVREDERFRDWRVRVVGSDISRKVLATARRGIYGPSSFRTTSDHLARKYFSEKDGKFQISDDVRSMCSFGQMNLLATPRFHVLGPCDVIFCRNVLMYLSAAARETIVDAFYEALNPGGYLLLGHSESLLNVTTRFDLVHLSKDLVYRRPV